jgi:hypothetical protein
MQKVIDFYDDPAKIDAAGVVAVVPVSRPNHGGTPAGMQSNL